jgi:osmotically-inducible protein OsmY
MKTDIQLQLDVIAELAYQPTLNSKNIGVAVNNGIVSLMGTVESLFEKDHAEAATVRVSGVKGIAMELEVKLLENSKRTDSGLAHSIDQIMIWYALHPENKIFVKVEKAWVTLEGEVQFYHQKAMLNSSITHLIGVLGITNHLVIKNDLPLTDIREDIVKALHRSVKNEAKDIHVSVKDGVVTLSGNVYSWHERSTIRNAAWNNLSVVQVIDNTTLSL